MSPLVLNVLSCPELDEQISCQLQIGNLSFCSLQLHMKTTRKWRLFSRLRLRRRGEENTNLLNSCLLNGGRRFLVLRLGLCRSYLISSSDRRGKLVLCFGYFCRDVDICISLIFLKDQKRSH